MLFCLECLDTMNKQPSNRAFKATSISDNKAKHLQSWSETGVKEKSKGQKIYKSEVNQLKHDM
jgi:hypothetical protein